MHIVGYIKIQSNLMRQKFYISLRWFLRHLVLLDLPKIDAGLNKYEWADIFEVKEWKY